jgi:uncharacterized membrane protein YtjA (UPF0391 family)
MYRFTLPEDALVLFVVFLILAVASFVFGRSSAA